MPELTFPSTIDSTMLSVFGSCPQKFFQEFILRKVPVGRNIHLHAGGCVASAMEDMRNFYYRDELDYDTCLEKAFGNFVTNWGDFETPEKEYKTFHNCWAVVEAYFQEYPMASDYFQPHFTHSRGRRIPSVEFKFGIPLEIEHPQTQQPLLYSGRLDLVAQPVGSDSVIAVDEKTAKTLGSSWSYQWDMRGQFYGYVWALRHYGYRCDAALVRGMAIQQTQFAFQEKTLFFSDFQIDRWLRATYDKIYKMIEMYEYSLEAAAAGKLESMHDEWTRSFGDACESYGGCQFTDLCTHPEPWVLYDSYEERIWDPLAKDPTAKSEDRLTGMETQSLISMIQGNAEGRV